MKNKFKLILIFCTSIITIEIAVAQQTKIDSLNILIKKDQTDTAKINHLNDLSWELMYNNPDTSIIISKKALSIAKQLKKTQKIKSKFIANSLGNIGVFYHIKGDYPIALDYYLKALKVNEGQNNKNGIARNLSNIGILYKDQGNYQNALTYYMKALKISENLNNKKEIANQLGNIGSVYYAQACILKENTIERDSLLNKALTHYFKALKIDEKLKNKRDIAADLGNIGLIYDDQKNYQSALTYYFKYLKIAEDIGNKGYQAIALGNIGSLYTETGKYYSAHTYLFRTLAISDSIGNTTLSEQIYKLISTLYEKSTLTLPDSIGGKTLNKEEMRLRALHYFKSYLTLRDSIFSEENKKQLVSKELTYKFEKKEAATLAEHEKQVAVTAAENRRQRLLLWLIVAIAISVSIIAIVILHTLRVTKKQKKLVDEKNITLNQQNVEILQQKEEISTQRDEIESQRDLVTEQKEHIELIHEELTDSIIYAKRIQKAVLPMENYINDFLHEYFILSKPKDIVSGDFFWITKMNSQILLCVTDCTGHGVPGAFMSMLGITLLNEIVRKEDITKASDVLNQLRKRIIESLKQKGIDNEQKDGMDMAFCAINTDTLEMQFAGANNPCWIIRNVELDILNVELEKYLSFKIQNSKFYELKGDKMPIGIHDRMNPFTNQIYQLQKSDTIYLMSDGFEDQFGGSNHKKFLSKNLKNLLIANCQLPIADQKQILETTITEWIGNEEQIDDITVMGIKI